MILLGLKIEIKNFWACNLSKKFPKLKFKILDIHPVSGGGRGFLEIFGEAKGKELVSFLKKQKGIKKADIIAEKPEKLLRFYFTHGPLSDILIKTGVHVRPPLFLENGFILVNVIGSESDVERFLSEGRKAKNVKICLLKKVQLEYYQKAKLTKLQEDIIKLAVREGFYDIPRKIRIEQLAKKLGMSKSTLAEHLRKAENRLIKDYF